MTKKKKKKKTVTELARIGDLSPILNGTTTGNKGEWGWLTQQPMGQES